MDQDATGNPPPPSLSGGGAVGAMEPAPPPTPWGVWSTIGWTLLIGFCYAFTQGIIFVICAFLAGFRSTKGPMALEKLESDGFIVSIATLLSAPVGAGLCVLLASFRKSIPIHHYFGLRWPGKWPVLRWIGILLAFGFLTDLATTQLLDQPLVPEVMVDLYRSARIPALIWLAIIVAAPVAEEFIFRGFFLTGLLGTNPSSGRVFASIFATSITWAAIHLQYDFYGMTVIFIAGLLLGYARVRTGSLWLCILLHMLMNLVATVQVVVFMT
jgi:uncharacterized protein